MKNKFYISLFIGVGLAIATTSSYAKPAHSAHKKNTPAATKTAKKQTAKSLKPSKNSKSQRHNAVIAASKHPSAKTHALKHQKNPVKIAAKAPPTHRQKHVIHNRHHPVKTIRHLEQIDHELDVIDQELAAIESTENAPRIHSLITDSPNSIIEPSYQDEAPHHYNSAHGIIRTSLEEAVQTAGLSNDLLVQLTNIFAWDIDFATNVYRGDQFTVIYQADSNGADQIIAAEFVTQGRILTAVRHENSEGNVNYYTPEGKVMRKAFLSSPVDYIRISSHFSSNRKHPILNRIRAHKGVDYAARTGTPVKAAGDGTVAFVGRKGGYGQVMIVKHGERYETLYAHLSGFKHGLHEGDAVNQGDIIGYVGQTGLATGPHLHYEFRVDGEHRNPEALNSRPAMALNGALLAAFKQQAKPALSELYHAKAQTLLAKNQRSIN